MGVTEKYEVEKGTVNTIMVRFKDGKTESEVAITDWINGDGFDISVDSNRAISVSYSELAALKFAMAQIDI